MKKRCLDERTSHSNPRKKQRLSPFDNNRLIQLRVLKRKAREFQYWAERASKFDRKSVKLARPGFKPTHCRIFKFNPKILTGISCGNNAKRNCKKIQFKIFEKDFLQSIGSHAKGKNACVRITGFRLSFIVAMMEQDESLDFNKIQKKRMTVSHLCHENGCMNRDHMIFEHLFVNQSRNFCLVEECKHKIKCLRDGKSSQPLQNSECIGLESLWSNK